VLEVGVTAINHQPGTKYKIAKEMTRVVISQKPRDEVIMFVTGFHCGSA
jgi:hypothetical protein